MSEPQASQPVSAALSEPAAEMRLLEGVAAAQAGRLSDAAAAWGQIISAAVSAGLRSQAWFNLALLWLQSGEPQSARAALEQALTLDDANHDAREQYAQLLAEGGSDDAAIEHYSRLAEAAPHVNHCFNLGVLHARAGRMTEAAEHYRRGLSLQGEHPETLANLGLLLAEQGEQGEALACLQKAVREAPDQPALHANLGALLEEADQQRMAIKCLEAALQLDPDNARYHCDLGVAYTELRQLDAAEQCFRKALALAPTFDAASVYLAQLLFAQGRYREGWSLHEARFSLSTKAGRPMRPHSSAPAWAGESLAGKVLLIRVEQGYGDEIQFFRYLQPLRACGAAKLIVLARPALLSLWRHQLADWPEVECLEMLDAPLPPHDVWTTLMSIPQWLPEAIPAPPYLTAPPSPPGVSMPGKGLRVGLLWQGNPLHLNDRHRSLPSIALLSPLWGLREASFVSLHRALVETELPLLQIPEQLADFAAVAAVMSQLDLVITVDSAYAHLAGALGVPVWVLLPWRRTDWRWGFVGDSSPWYPTHMRLFRQSADRDWAEPIAAAAYALQDFEVSIGRCRRLG